MIRNLFLCFFLFLLQVPLFAQTPLDAAQWQADLKFLQEKIHSDYPMLFHQVSPEEFDAAVKDLHRQIPTMERHEIIIGIARVVAMFRIGHTMLPLQVWQHTETNPEFNTLPMAFYHFDDGLYVQGTSKEYPEALGAKVTHIGKWPVEEALNKLRTVVSAENDQYFKGFGMSYLSSPQVLHACGISDQQNAVALVVEKNGQQLPLQVKGQPGQGFPGSYGFVQSQKNWQSVRPDNDATPYYLKHLNKPYYMEYLTKEKAVYVRQSQVLDDPAESLEDFYARVFEFVANNEVEKFILDVRLNGGGNNYKNRPLIIGLIQAKKINQKGRLFTIIGRRTFSACQNLVNELEKYTETIFVGEPTAENVNFFGDTRTEILPNSQLPVRLSYLWWQNHDPRDTREWTTPDIAIDLSFADYQNNEDPALEAILAYQVQEPISTQLAALLEKGKKQEAQDLARTFMQNPQNRYSDFESDLNNMGYRQLRENQKDMALAFFLLNAHLYPDSANVWDSLAEGYMESGDSANAVKYYQKALAMDPGGATGANSKRMLEQIKKQKP